MNATDSQLNATQTARDLRTSLKLSQANEAHIRLYNHLGTQLFNEGWQPQSAQTTLLELCELFAADHGLIAIEHAGVLTTIAAKGYALPIGTRIPMMGHIAQLLKTPVQFNCVSAEGTRLWTTHTDQPMQTWLLPIALQQKSVGLLGLSAPHLQFLAADLPILQSICGLLGLALQKNDQKTTTNTDKTLLDQLTPREREIFALLPSGLSNIELAAKLGIAPGTVKIHVERIFGKLGLRDRTQAAIKAVEMGYKSHV